MDDYIDELNGFNKWIEIMCNSFAGKFLVPDSDFDNQISGQQVTELIINSLAERYVVSREVILRKFLDRELIDWIYYEDKVNEWNDKAKQTQERSGGGNYYNTKIAYLGNNYLNLVMGAYYRNNIDVNKVADYLNIKVNHVASLEAAYKGVIV